MCFITVMESQINSEPKFAEKQQSSISLIQKPDPIMPLKSACAQQKALLNEWYAVSTFKWYIFENKVHFRNVSKESIVLASKKYTAFERLIYVNGKSTEYACEESIGLISEITQSLQSI